MTIVQMPQTCSRQLMSQTGGVVCLPSIVTGFFRISINAEITLRFRRYGSSNVSQLLGRAFVLAPLDLEL